MLAPGPFLSSSAPVPAASGDPLPFEAACPPLDSCTPTFWTDSDDDADLMQLVWFDPAPSSPSQSTVPLSKLASPAAAFDQQTSDELDEQSSFASCNVAHQRDSVHWARSDPTNLLDHACLQDGDSQEAPDLSEVALHGISYLIATSQKKRVWTEEEKKAHSKACHGKSKLPIMQKLKIIELYEAKKWKSQTEIASIFGISRSAVCKILRPESVQRLKQVAKTVVESGSLDIRRTRLPAEASKKRRRRASKGRKYAKEEVKSTEK
eukprot:768392-Hanusia_phi.AAC.15